MQRYHLILALMIVNLLLLSSSYTIVMPFIPVYLKEELLVKDEFLSFWSSACYAITFIIAALISPLWGHFADKVGKKAMLVRVSFILAIAYFLGYLAQTPLQLFFARAFQGFASGMWPAVLAIISGFVPKEKTGLAMGVAQSANLLGTVIGPAFGGFIIVNVNVSSCFLITSTIAFIITILNIFLAKEPRVHDLEKQSVKDNLSFKELIKNNDLKLLMLATVSQALSLMALVPVIALHVDKLLLDDPKSMMLAGLVFSASGFAGILASPIWGHLTNKFEGLKLLSVICFMTGLFYSLQSMQCSLYIFAILQFLGGLSICGIAPTVHTKVAMVVSDNHSAKAFSLVYACQQIGNCIGPIIAGLFMYLFNTGAVIFTVGIYLIMVSLIIFYKSNRN